MQTPQDPLTRRSFVVAREVLCAAGREDLADALLRLLGSFALSRAEAETLTAEAERTYDVAVEVRRTPVAMDWNVSHDTRGGRALRAFMPALREGCEALLARAPGLLD